MSILKKAVSASGPALRVLLGAGALALVIIGLFKKPKKDGETSRRVANRMGGH